MASEKAQELRVLLGVAIRLRGLAERGGEPVDVERFVAAAAALEARAQQLAFGDCAASAAAQKTFEKVDLVC